ncbi:MAG: ligase-associated DNA damage response endonuclease PdeM [Burkholderiaceae bacterium]|nr:ligase-associated DNA damage response endonuclease PdeM [Burkholderiaceae bacterium]
MHPGRLDLPLPDGSPAALLADRALLLREHGVLVVADVHFGKAATFRARGVPVPQGTTTDNLRRLETLLADTGAGTLVFLGDLFHAREAHARDTLAALRVWRERHPHIEMLLVEGNHDRHAGAPPAALGLRVVQEPFALGPLALCHHPQSVAGRHVIAGHLHPCVRLYGGAYDSVRLPCFWMRSALTLLPAFGEFTGGAPIPRNHRTGTARYASFGQHHPQASSRVKQ